MNKIVFLFLLPLTMSAMETPLPAPQKTITNLLLNNPNILGQRIKNSTLDLSGLGLTSLKGLQDIPGIQTFTHLDLGHNKLTKIPPPQFCIHAST